jgi:hypothetical protein
MDNTVTFSQNEDLPNPALEYYFQISNILIFILKYYLCLLILL